MANSKSGTGLSTSATTAASPCFCRSSHGSRPFGSTANEGLRDETLVVFKGAHGRLLTRGVTIEGEDHLAAERVVVHQQAPQDLDVVRQRPSQKVAIAVSMPARWQAMTSV